MAKIWYLNGVFFPTTDLVNFLNRKNLTSYIILNELRIDTYRIIEYFFTHLTCNKFQIIWNIFTTPR